VKFQIDSREALIGNLPDPAGAFFVKNAGQVFLTASISQTPTQTIQISVLLLAAKGGDLLASQPSTRRKIVRPEICA
jgi:hypothetical protein